MALCAGCPDSDVTAICGHRSPETDRVSFLKLAFDLGEYHQLGWQPCAGHFSNLDATAKTLLGMGCLDLRSQSCSHVFGGG